MVNRRHIILATGLVTAAASGCVSTDFDTLCELDPDATACADANGDALDADARDSSRDTLIAETAGDADADSDSGSPVVDSGADTRRDSAAETLDSAAIDSAPLDTAPDTTPETFSDAACEAGATDSQPCGNCGVQTRSCVGGSWSTWGSCTGEGVCAAGGTRTIPCGSCGSELDTCSSACAWVAGTCTGEGVCAPGETRTLACGSCGSEVDTCSSSCTWAAGSCTGTGICAPGAGRTVPCGNCGTESDTCSTSCSWVTGSCTAEGVCAPGAVDSTATGCTGIQIQTRTCASTCSWGAYGACDYPKGWTNITPSTSAGLSARDHAGFAWTGSELIAMGGYDGSSWVNDGGAYNPVTDKWRKLSTAPLTRVADFAVTVWIGDRVFVLNDGNVGAMYFPGSDTWSTSVATSPLAPRQDAMAVWSSATSEVIVWGGISGSTTYANGAAYKPSTNSWRPLSAAPISGRGAGGIVYAAGRVVIFGGICSYTPPTGCADGAIYNPTSDSWSALSVPVSGGRAEMAYADVRVPSERATFWGGSYGGVSPHDGFFNDPLSNTSTVIPAPPTSPYVDPSFPIGWADGSSFCTWGPTTGTGDCYDGTSWTAVPTGGPSPRTYSAYAWTGSALIVWGGEMWDPPNSPLSDGKILRR